MKDEGRIRQLLLCQAEMVMQAITGATAMLSGSFVSAGAAIAHPAAAGLPAFAGMVLILVGLLLVTAATMHRDRSNSTGRD
jgi:hypothetical protein